MNRFWSWLRTSAQFVVVYCDCRLETYEPYRPVTERASMFSEETKALMMRDIQALHPHTRTAGATPSQWLALIQAIEGFVSSIVQIFWKPPLT